jgi:hypothetical protein
MNVLNELTPNIHRIRPGAQLVRSGLTARLAVDEKTKADAYAVRHASYLSGGFIDPRPDGLFSDDDDLRPNSQSVVIYQWDQPVASVRFCTLDLTPGLTGWDEIPASRIFPEAIAELAARLPHNRPARMIELNRLVRHPDYANNTQLVFVLFRFVCYLVTAEGADMMLSCVRRNHTPFYKRMRFGYVDGPRRYAGVKFETNLMACPESQFAMIRSEIPMVSADPATRLSYAPLLEGKPVNVFLEA